MSLLQKIGFELVDTKTLSFYFPEDKSCNFSWVGLPVFLARYGIPNVHKLDREELKKIILWTRLANIPKEARSQLVEFSALSSEAIKAILRKFNFEIFEDTIYIPNCPHNNRTPGFHKFTLNQFELEFRSFLGWKLDCASMTGSEDDADIANHFEFVSKLKLNTPEHKRYSKLRLWAATQNAPLPDYFSGKVDFKFIRALVDPEIMISVSIPPTDIISEDEKNHPPNQLKKSVQSWQEKYAELSNPAIPMILEKLGFANNKGNGSYTHPAIDEGKSMTLTEVRRHLLQHYIVDFEKKKRGLSKSERKTLQGWCTHIHLDDEVFTPYLSEADVLTEYKLQQILQKLGFQTVDRQYFLPGADNARQTRTAYSWNELLEYCRSNDVWSINDAEVVGTHSYQKFGVGLSDWVNMLLTMARVDAPIRAFQTPPKPKGRSKRHRQSLGDDVDAMKSRKISLDSASDDTD